MIAAAPRLFAGLMQEADLAPVGERIWGESRLAVPAGRYENVLTGERHDAGAGTIRVAERLKAFPAVLLVATRD